MDAITLTKEETEAAIKEAEKAKVEKEKGTSVENNQTIMELSPEMRAALAEGVTSAVKEMWKQESEHRQKVFSETRAEASANVGSAVQSASLKHERERQENKILIGFLTGARDKDRGKVREAYEKEAEYLGRDTVHTSKELAEERAMGAATAGDEFVPEIWETRIVDNIERLGLVRRRARRIPMASDTVHFPKITTGLTAYEVSAQAQITASDLVTAQLTLNARKLATITAMQNELIADSNPQIVPFIIEHAAVALAKKEDELAFTGSGSTVTGILESSTNEVYLGGSSTSGSTSISDTDFDDAARLLDELSDQYISDEASYYWHKKVLFHLHTLTISNDYAWAPAAAGSPRTIRGFPYFTSSTMPSAPSIDTALGFFGDLRHLYMGDRQQMTVAIGREGTVASANMFEKDMTAIRVTERVEFEIADLEAFAILKTAAA